ncbi:WHy domain-containing lipoprotein [Geomonas limicola]|uniref:WHy domain-containing lipoprotein n=1 Tax=Geomonas limicola TaxID=2740186 RepID=A0A6V8NAQ1_9BACT|nr:LEA type 2 family protein [Geomonas limicola]GFO68299.1 WHy domain-containing lipoprotein [Geomonas limicola]
MKKAVRLVVLVLLLSGCTLFVKEPQVAVRDLNVVSLDPAGLGMELYLTVNNPNSFDVRLLGYSYDLKVMALPLAKGGARDEVRFAANSETGLRIPVKIGYNELIEILKRIPDPDHIPYALSAGLELETPVGQRNIPVNRTGTYAVPPQYRPGNLLKGLGNLFRGRE